MKKKYTLFLILLIPVILFLSCQKELFKHFSDLNYSERSFSFTNTAPVNLKTSTGLKLSFPANAFVTSNGQPVSGNINLLVKEILKPDAMIFYKMPTVSKGLPLESGGEFYLHATSGNNVLRLAPGSFVRMELPRLTYSMDGMRVFNGIEDSNTGAVDWQMNSNNGVQIIPADSSSGNNTGHILFSDSIEWINCDRLIDEPLITFIANAGNSPDMDSTAVYVHLTGRNSVLQLPGGINLFASAKLIAAPATIVGICSKNGNLSASFSTVNMQHGQSITLNFSPTSQETLKQRLATLK